MRFAGMALDGGNYVNAAKNSGGAMDSILAKNSPDYGMLSNAASAGQSSQRVTGMNAKASVQNAGINSLASAQQGAFGAQGIIAQGEASASNSISQGFGSMLGSFGSGFATLGAKGGSDKKQYDAKHFDLNNVSNKGYSFFMGTIVEISKQKIPIKEIPIIFKDRKKGYSKIPKLEIFRTLKNLFFIMLKN